jgi:hypothetical protein
MPRVSQELGKRIAQILRNALEPSLVAAPSVDAKDACRQLTAVSIFLLLKRGHFLLGPADLGFPSATQSQKFFLAAEI